MHNIKSLLRFHSAMIILLTMVLAACQDDMMLAPGSESDDLGREVMLPLSLDVEEMVTLNSVSRGEDGADDDYTPTVVPPDPKILEEETRLHDFWIIQYNDKGYRVGMPYYQEYSGREGENRPIIPILIPTQEGKKFTTVVIANTGNPSLFNDENSATVRAVKDVHKPMKNADDVWSIIDGERYLPMSGKVDVDINTLSLSTHIRPNVAKLHLYFKLMKTTDGEGDAGGGNSWDRKRKILAVNWGNVPDMPYADILYDADNYNDDDHRFPSPVNKAKLNLFRFTDDTEKYKDIVGYSLDMSDKPSTIDVYLPRNTQGVNKNTDPYLKATYATENALFLEIVNSDKEETQQNKWRRIEFLVGGNDVNDYNIIPGKYYDIDFTFSNFPTDDGPVKKMYRRYPEGNAYIVNPNDTRIVNRFPISPVNNYATECYPGGTNTTYTNWEEGYFRIYLQELKEVDNDVTGQLTQDPATWKNRAEYFTTLTDDYHEPNLEFAITPDTEWVAEVIWQDCPERLINFCDYLGLLTNNGDFYESAGAMWLPVKINDFNIFKQTFLLKGGTTNELDPAAFKDPYNDRNPTRSEIFFKTTGAEGNAIVGIRKKSEGSKPVEQRDYLWSWHLWITNYNPAELGQSTMDRNIGAMTTTDPGFYYQWDRKDPFPYWGVPVYDINGVELTQLRHEVGSGENKVSASMLCFQHAALTTTRDLRTTQTNAVKWPYKLFYHTGGKTATTLANKNYIGQTVRIAGSWTLPTSTINWTPQDPSPQGWVLPPDEKQHETPPGSWTIISSWQGLGELPRGGLRADTYRYTTLFDLYRGENAFLWVKTPGVVQSNPAPNTGTFTAPYYPEGVKSMVDALPVRCTRR